MAAVTTAIIAGTTILNAFSSLSSGRKKRARQRLIAAEKEKQALEVARRTESELGVIRDSAREVVGQGDSAFASNGIDVGSQASVQTRMKSFENLGRVVLNKRLESQFRQNQLRLEARLGKELGDDLRETSVIQAVGSLASGVQSLSNAGAFSKSSGGSSGKN